MPFAIGRKIVCRPFTKPKDTSSFYVIIAIETYVEAYVANDERTIRSELVQLDGQHRDKIFEQLVPIPSACSIDMAFQSGRSVIRRMRERTDREIVTERLLIICGMQSKRAE